MRQHSPSGRIPPRGFSLSFEEPDNSVTMGFPVCYNYAGHDHVRVHGGERVPGGDRSERMAIPEVSKTPLVGLIAGEQ